MPGDWPAPCFLRHVASERGPSLGRTGVGTDRDKKALRWGGRQDQAHRAAHVCPERPYNRGEGLPISIWRERGAGPRVQTHTPLICSVTWTGSPTSLGLRVLICHLEV